MAIVAANKNFDIYLTSTPPDQLRFRILHANSNFKTRLSMYYFTSNRVDLYKNEAFVPPTNAYYSNGNMLLADPSANINAYKPTYLNDSGTNLYYKADRKLYFSMSGSDYIDLKITKVINLKFGVPAVTDDTFFDSATLIQNFAALLGVDPSKIRKVEIVRAARKRRSARSTSDEIQIVLTIYDDPVQLLSQEAQINVTNADLEKLEMQIVNKYLTGQLQDEAVAKLNVSLTSFLLTKSSANNQTEIEITKLKKIVVLQEANNCNAQVPCAVQPILQILDEYVSVSKRICFPRKFRKIS